jgi:hypothetical protein
MSQHKELAKEFRRQAKRRARQLEDRFDDIVEIADSEAVHDFRKATRHLQAVVETCGINSHGGRAKRLRRKLRNSATCWAIGGIPM